MSGMVPNFGLLSHVPCHRRGFLRVGLSASLATAPVSPWSDWLEASPPACPREEGGSWEAAPPVYSIIPVVGDGRWVWTEPPDETGYLEPRDFQLRIGIEVHGRDRAKRVKATTPVPVQLPEQSLRDVAIETNGCQAGLRAISPEAGQLLLFAPTVAKQQRVSASVTTRLTLTKQYLGFSRDQFTEPQPPPSRDLRRLYLGDSPGIQTRIPEVRRLVRQLGSGDRHPWVLAAAIHQWVWENIRARTGTYTSVERALADRVGDCEERAAVFVALCRAAGIPARLVWVPNHEWAEFYLVDESDNGHWIPAHTACYSWFGWTGVHELVIQKGDHLIVPEKNRPQRLLRDWVQWIGSRPEVRYTAELTPLAAGPGDDPGPGARRKNEHGEWTLQGGHELDNALRDGASAMAYAR